MDFDAVKALRDKRLRKRILRILNGAKVGPRGGFGGRALRDMLDSISPSADQCEDDAHLLGLCRDLAGSGYLRETDERTRKSQRWGLEYMFYAITTLGVALVEELIDPSPLVDDDRL